jgi:hypothetical protein
MLKSNLYKLCYNLELNIIKYTWLIIPFMTIGIISFIYGRVFIKNIKKKIFKS